MRRLLAAGAVVVIVVATTLFAPVALPRLATPAFAQPPAGGTTVVAETFTGASVPDPAWTKSGSTCLTGAATAPPAGAAQVPVCTLHAGGAPASGVTPGYLQLTDASNDQAGSIVYNRPIPSTAGISVVFEQYQYGGNEADGIGFFLADGATPVVTVGAPGGSLGYAQRTGAPGVPGGYLGVGLDVFGNFYDDGEGRGTNCPAGQRSPAGTATGRIGPNIVTLRGPGQGTNGYCWLNSTSNNTASPTSTLPGSLRGVPGPGNNLTPVKRLVNIQITPAPNPRVIVEIDFTGTGSSWVTVLNTPAPQGTPSTYKFGFLGSTGGNNDVHLIRNVVVKTINTLDQLDLVKQVRRTPPLSAVIVPGTVVTYDYLVTNAGLETLTNLSVTDNKVASVVCPVSTLPPAPSPAASTVCTGTYQVTAADAAAGSITNTATAAATSPGGSVTSPPANVVLPLVSRLAIAKTVQTPGPYSIGQSITYGYTVTNTGATRLSSVAVQDNRVSAGAVVCALNALDPGQFTTCTGPYTIRLVDIAAGGTLTNTASATGVSPIGQSVLSPNATQTIPVAADIAVTKTVSDSRPAVGDTITFTVRATNLGPSAAGQVQIIDLVPPGLSLVTAAPSAGSYVPATGLWTIPSLALNAAATLTLTATVLTAAAITNGASVTTTQVPDPNPDNNTASVDLNPVVPTVDIAITKRASQPTIRVGQVVTFLITATNNGPFPATNVLVQDVLPSKLTLVSAVANRGAYNDTNVTWTVGDLAVGQTATLTFQARGNDTGQVINTAALVSSSPTDSNDLNNIDSAAVNILPPLVDLVTTKVVTPANAQVGDVVEYTITAFNNGPDPVNDVVVRELGTAPPGLEIVSSTATKGTFDEATLDWSVGTLLPGAPVEILKVAVRVNTPGTKGDTVVIEAPNITDSDPTNNVADATLVAASLPLDIAVTKSTSASLVQRGQNVTFTIAATNNGPNAATGLTFRDGLPPGFTFVSSSGPGTYDPDTSVWAVGALASGATVQRTITATATSVGSWVNAVTLDQVDQRDTDQANNSANVPVTVDEQADLVITKNVTPTIAEPGDIVTYQIDITNNGPNDTDNVLAVDPRPIDADIVSTSVSPGTSLDLPRRLWNVGHLAVNQTVTLIAQIRVTGVGTTTNIVQITQTSTPDPNLTNNTARATLSVPAADLSITKQATATQATVGDEIIFTITATNTGPDTAIGATVNDPLPSALAFVDAQPSIGAYDLGTGVWTIGDMLPGDTQTLQIRVRVTTAGDILNQATIAGEGPVDPDTTNNSAQVPIHIIAQPTPTPSGSGTPPGPGGATATGGLALTGVGTWYLLVVLAAGLLLLAGLGLVARVERRR